MDPFKFSKKLHSRDAVIGIIGLGYVGLPLLIRFAKCNFQVVGFDSDESKIASIEAGKSYIRHIKSEEIADNPRITATGDVSHLAMCDAVIICVPTPLNANREPDMSCILSAADTIAPYLQRNQLIVLESTTYPGTTDTLLRNRLESQNALRAGLDYALAFSPEREDPGNKNWSTKTVPKIVGGLTPDCMICASQMYKEIIDHVVPVSSTRIAEMTKLLENIFRSVNIALVNEIKMLCHRMDIDPFEVISAAATKPFGFMPFMPGPGLGGHCIPIDPFYLTWKAREYHLSTKFIELAGEINTTMPEYVISRLTDALGWHGKSLRDARILILGVAYKPDIDDMRESPALRIIDILQDKGAKIQYHDPFIPKLPEMEHHNHAYESVPLSPESAANADAVVIVTDHSNVDYDMVAKHAKLVIDTRNVIKDRDAHIVAA